MGLLDSILGAMNQPGQPGQPGATGQDNPLLGALGGILNQSGGLNGLMEKFSRHGQGDTFSSWVGTGQNQPVSSGVIQQVLGSEQVANLAARLGLSPGQVAQFLAQYLPMIIDKLTPGGRIDPGANPQQSLAALLPSLLQQIGTPPPDSPPPA